MAARLTLQKALSMSLTRIADTIRRNMRPEGFDGSIKLDCGPDGVVVIAGPEVTREDRVTDCTIALSADDLIKLMTGKLNPVTGVMLGKLKVSGDVKVAMRLGKLLKG